MPKVCCPVKLKSIITTKRPRYRSTTKRRLGTKKPQITVKATDQTKSHYLNNDIIPKPLKLPESELFYILN